LLWPVGISLVDADKQQDEYKEDYEYEATTPEAGGAIDPTHEKPSFRESKHLLIKKVKCLT
jgi:hypothetical protein